jgi:uncharacterized repeat protein (TIGR01451 family)
MLSNLIVRLARDCRPGTTWVSALPAALALTAGLAAASPAAAQLTVTPITWDVVGLDHNRPLTSGPELFPSGARVCSATATTNVQVDFVWSDGNGSGWDFGPGDAYINSRPGSLTSLVFASIGAGECVDAYFELQVTRSASAFGQNREYAIVATDLNGSVSTPTPRQIYVEQLVSQNRNTTTQIRYGQQEDQSDWVLLGYGGSMNLAVGNRYFLELTTQTSTSYEELQSFLTLSNTIFQVIGVSTTYSVLTAPPSRVPVPNPSLWADGCEWESNPDSPNYNSCLAAGKAGGVVVTTYEIEIISGGGDSIGLIALIYDRSGSSFHYNTDFSTPQGQLETYDPANSGFSKRFVPDTIGPGGTSRLRFTITNPNPLPITGYNFLDELPAGVLVAAPSNATTTCGGTVTAVPGTDEVALAGGTVAAGGSCSVLVDVTAAAPGTYDNVSQNLFIGDVDTGNNATATLTVSSTPPPVLSCDENATLALWEFPLVASSTAPAPTSSVVTATAASGAGTTPSISAQNNDAGGSWATDNVQTGALNTGNQEYFEFVVDTTGLDSITVDFASRRTVQGAQNIQLYYGPAAENASTVYSIASAATWIAQGPTVLSTGLNPSGNTIFRFYVYNASVNSGGHLVFLDGMRFRGLHCEEVPPPPPTPGVLAPTIVKAFSPTTIGVGHESTLAFIITNPNLATALSGITFTDELPFGLDAVPGTFGGTCTGYWDTHPDDAGILLHSGGSLAGGASCTLEVDVTSSTVGTTLNISDPIYATESGYNTDLATGVAQDSLVVLASPDIAKEFVPNLVLIGVTPNDASTLTFTVTNPNPDDAIAGVSFTDNLPVGLEVASPPNAGTSGCGAPVWAPAAGATSLVFSGGSIAAGDSCTVTVDVTGPVGLYDNVSSAASHIVGGQPATNGETAEASLQIDEPIPGLSVEKLVGPGSDPDLDPWSDYLAVEAGEDVFYKIVVENTGELPLSGLAVSDPDVDTTGCVWPDPLPVADVLDSHIATCIVGPVAAVSGTLVNTATADASSSSGPVDDLDSATYSTVGLSFTKSAVPLVYTTAGEDIDYTFTLTNDGPAILAGPVTITDPLVPGAVCPALATVGNLDAFLDPGESVACTGTYTIQASDVTNASVTNTAYASAGGFDSPDDSVTVMTPPPTTADVIITKSDTGSDPAELGGTVTYTIEVTNAGPADAEDVVVVDTLDAQTSYVSDTGGCVEAPAGTLTCNLGTITAAGSTSFTVTVGVSSSAATSGTLSPGDCDGSEDLCNTASVSSSTTEADPSDNSDSEPTDVTPEADLRVEKTGPASVVPGEQVVYTITVTNDGPSAADNVSVADPTPSGLAFVSNTGDCVTTFPCSLGTLASGASAVITSTYDVPASYAGPDPVENTATVSSTTDDPDLSNNDSTASAPVAASADVSIAKSDSGASVERGNNLTYTLLVANAGPSDATNVVVTDVLDANTTYVSDTGGCVEAPAGTLTCTFASLAAAGSTSFDVTVLVGAGAPDAGSLESGACDGSEDLCNTASVASDAVDPDATDNTDTEPSDVLPAAPSADVSITKTSAAGTVQAGAFTSYALTVSNDGPDSAEDIVVTDVLDVNTTFVASTIPCTEAPAGTLTCAIGTIASGASVPFEIVVHVDPAAPTAQATTGSPCTGMDDLCNEASVATSTDDPDPSNDTDSVATDVVAATIVSALTMTKSDLGMEPVVPGSNVTYELVVDNAGPDDADDVVVYETLDPFMTYVSDTAGCVLTDAGDGATTGARLTCPLGTITAGNQASFEIVVTIGASAPVSSVQQDGDCAGAEDVCNEAVVATSSADFSIVDNDDSEPTDVSAGAGCGNGGLDAGEQCDPPSSEVCNNTIDDDADLLIDCVDPDCLAPGFQSCDGNCQLTTPCVPILNDPARLRSDYVKVHGKFIPTTGVNPLLDGFTFLVANDEGEVFRAELFEGDLELVDGRQLLRWAFKDHDAKHGGGRRGGIAQVRVKQRRERDGQISYPFKIKAYGDMSKAIKARMTTQVYIDDDVAFLTATWLGKPGRWWLTQKQASAGLDP